jgi:hypothetical protein
MMYPTTRNKAKILRAAMYLRHEGFTVGQTRTGFVAVDDDGIVIQATPYRTSAQIFHPTLKIYREEYALSLQEIYWFTEKLSLLTEWAKDPNAKEPGRVLSISRKPVPSRQRTA